MSEAPERIWAWAGSYPTFDSGDWCNGTATDDASRGGVEYVRADRIEELVKERDEARTAWEIEAATVDRFAERHERHLVMGAESRARIEELEAKLRHYKKEVVETAEANEADANARAEELEAQLAKAVETLKRYGGVMPVAFAPIQDGGYKARTTLAELTGGKDDRQR